MYVHVHVGAKILQVRFPGLAWSQGLSSFCHRNHAGLKRLEANIYLTLQPTWKSAARPAKVPRGTLVSAFHFTMSDNFRAVFLQRNGT